MSDIESHLSDNVGHRGSSGTGSATQNAQFVAQNAHIVRHKFAEIQQNPVFMHVGTRGTMGRDKKRELGQWDMGQENGAALRRPRKSVSPFKIDYARIARTFRYSDSTFVVPSVA
ncbi:MAG: hypothetical protein ABJB40_08585 [Acidobacteriota bacterium]